MLRVCLTGSIGVGKSFVTSVLNDLGCHTLDADLTAREVVLPGSPGLAAIINEFGADVLEADGTLNRKVLGALVFADERKRELLNSILHPIIIERQDQVMREWEAQDPNGIGVIDAALAIESGGYRRFDKLIVVHCRPEIQLQRIMERDGISRTQAEARVAAQMSQEEKLKLADLAIDTSEGFAETRRRTEDVYRQLRLIADKA
ncbi:MAG TPA: dephospho-CoA kinase [Pyrinomonadaceae bacterium]